MIEKISIKNFKSHADTTIELGRVTALVGPNGCGKTSVLQAVHFISQLADQTWFKLLNGGLIPNNYVMRGKDQATICVVGNKFPSLDPEKKWKIKIGIHKNDQAGTNAKGWYLAAWHDEVIDGTQEETSESMHEGYRLSHYFDQDAVASIKNTAYLKAAFYVLAQPTYSEDIPPVLEADGNNLASAVAYLMTATPEKHKQIEEQLKEIVPSVRAVRVRPAKITRYEQRIVAIDNSKYPLNERREVMGHELLFDTTTAQSIPANEMSDGTLFTLGMLITLQSRTDPGVILIDDIEHGLHPLAQIRLMQTLKAFAEQHNRQIIFTSHSPYILDALSVEDVWVMATDPQGISRCKRLSEHPDIKTALGALTTGETWSAEGEEWVYTEPEAVNA